MPKFSIIIVSWNALHHLQRFLPSIAATGYDNFEIILADNASTDGSKQWVEQHYPGITLVTFGQNYGYCGGNNRAVPYATGDILVFLNNDVKVEPDWLGPLAKLFEQNRELAAAQPKIRSYKNPELFEYAGAAGGFIDRYGYPFCRGRIFDSIEKDAGQYDGQTDIFWASGAALAIRKEIFQQMGGFDEDFEFHMEEIDLCWRLWNQGHKVAYCPGSVAYHLGGGSLAPESPRKLYYNYRNSLIMLWKNYSRVSLVRFPVRVMWDLLSLLRELVSGRFANVKAICKAYGHFWDDFAGTNKKREHLQQKRVHRNDPDAMQTYSIIWQYFGKKITRFTDLPQKN